MAEYSLKNLPKSVEIGPLNWTFSYDSLFMKTLHRKGVGDVYGQTDMNICTIYIEIDQHPLQFVKDTILHEILHAVMMTFGIDVNIADDEDREEYIVASLTPGMLTTMQQNKKLFNWLMTKE